MSDFHHNRQSADLGLFAADFLLDIAELGKYSVITLFHATQLFSAKRQRCLKHPNFCQYWSVIGQSRLEYPWRLHRAFPEFFSAAIPNRRCEVERLSVSNWEHDPVGENERPLKHTVIADVPRFT